MQDCHLCTEREYGTPIWGEGYTDESEVCIIGRSGSTFEKRINRVFVGPAGRKLQEGLGIAHLLKARCWVTNLVKCPIPAGCTPTKECYIACGKEHLSKEIDRLKKLKLITTLGNQSLMFFEPLARVADLHGTAFSLPAPWNKEIRLRIFVTFNPSTACRNDDTNKKFLNDMEQLRLELGTL